MQKVLFTSGVDAGGMPETTPVSLVEVTKLTFAGGGTWFLDLNLP